MRRLLLPVILLLIASVVFAWWWNQPGRVIARRVADLFEAANIPADMSNIGRGTRGSAIEPYIAKNVLFEGPDGPADELEGSQSRDFVTQTYSGLATYCRSATVQDVEVQDVRVSGEEAEVKATIDAVVELPNAQRPIDGIQHLDMTWKKEDGKWKLARAKWTEGPRK
ncbi:hypothetical protein [Luteolibacter sp. Populi]|uniref:hypothetical protein n=1 Tax=Luteolibacter sp. Populi TaxID=3230487 RepID=UPI00346598CD